MVDKASYRKLVADLYFVYTAMEEEIAKLGDHPVGPACRSSTAAKPWSRISPTTTELAGRIRSAPSGGNTWGADHAVAQESPELLVGHHYTRYLGDLSGGQILKNIAQKAMNMDGDDGLHFYVFNDIADEKALGAPTAPRWMNCPSIKRWRIGCGRGQPRVPPEHEHVQGTGRQSGGGHRQGAVRLPDPSPAPAARRRRRLDPCHTLGIRVLVPGTSQRFRCGGLSELQTGSTVVEPLFNGSW